MTWAFLSADVFTLEQWGPNATQLSDILLKHESAPVELCDIPCFQLVLEQWQGFGRQGDPVEFLAHMMRGFQFTGINLSWEKRIQVGLLTETMDEGERFMPLILQFDPALIQDGKIPLRQMIRDWSNRDGMLTALTNDTLLVCVQIDRHVRSGTRQIQKCDILVNFHWGIEVPFFVNTGLEVQWKDYKVIAAVAHLGLDESGHCRTMLKVQMNAEAPDPYMFILTDDWVKATPIWKEPDWFHRNITCFWLCECQHMALLPLTPDWHQPKQSLPDSQRLVQASDLLSHFLHGTEFAAPMDGD